MKQITLLLPLVALAIKIENNSDFESDQIIFPPTDY